MTRIGRPGKIETRGQVVLCRLQGKPPTSFPKDSLAANQENQLIIEGSPLMQGDQHVLLAQKQAQPQTEATP